MLVPTDLQCGVNLQSLAESQSFKSGTFTNVPVPTSFETISKKAMQQSKRAMIDGWSFQGPAVAQLGAQRYASAKVGRAQLGQEIHLVWLKDLIQHCGVKVVIVNDFAHGSAEIQKAVVDARISVEATQAGVRVCSFCHDPRRVFAELGSARILTRLGNLYLENKVTLPGHTSVQSPGDEPARSRHMIKALLPTPFKVLSLTSAGLLQIPDDSSMAQSCPVTLSSLS